MRFPMIEQPSFPAFEERIGYHFQDASLLQEALTHSSYANEHKEMKGIYNERIEFLGDAVLELNISDWLFRQFPHFKEGQLTKLRAQIVCEDSLSMLAKECSLNEYLLLGKRRLLVLFILIKEWKKYNVF